MFANDRLTLVVRYVNLASRLCVLHMLCKRQESCDFCCCGVRQLTRRCMTIVYILEELSSNNFLDKVDGPNSARFGSTWTLRST